MSWQTESTCIEVSIYVQRMDSCVQVIEQNYIFNIANTHTTTVTVHAMILLHAYAEK